MTEMFPVVLARDFLLADQAEQHHVTTTPRSSTRDIRPQENRGCSRPCAPASCGTDARRGLHGGRGTSRSFDHPSARVIVVGMRLKFGPGIEAPIGAAETAYEPLHESPSPETPGFVRGCGSERRSGVTGAL